MTTTSSKPRNAKDAWRLGNAGRILGNAVTRFEARVLELMAHDLTMQQIASRIGFSDSTVRMESLAIYRALGVHDRHQAVETARSSGLLPRLGSPLGS